MWKTARTSKCNAIFLVEGIQSTTERSTQDLVLWLSQKKLAIDMETVFWRQNTLIVSVTRTAHAQVDSGAVRVMPSEG